MFASYFFDDMFSSLSELFKKKYDANIGTTRHASASQHAHLLSLSVFFRVDIIS